jgi:DegV family protein with EDD domain
MMRLLTNPGSNLSQAQTDHYRVTVLPQRILVDGVAHDTRDGISFEMVDGWVRHAERWPSTLGTTATETVAAFQALAKEGAREMIVVTTSKKIINSYDSAVVARETFLSSPHGRGCRIEIVDTGATDVAANLVCALAGEAMRAKLPFDDVVRILAAAVSETRLVLSLVTLDNMVKGGRASFLRRFIADMLGLRPIIAFLPDGTMGSVGTYKKRGESIAAITQWVRGQVEPGRRVWLAAFHTGESGAALALLDELRRVYDVATSFVRPLAPGVYLHAGPGAVGVAVCPIDRLGWRPPVPAI